MISTTSSARMHEGGRSLSPEPRRFFVAFTVVVAALVFAGFSRTFFLPLARNTFTATWFVYAHGALFFSWVALLVTQAVLMARRRASTHRWLGRISYALIPLMVIFGSMVAFTSSARGVHNGRGDAAISFLFGALMDLVMFGALATAAVLLRQRPQAHKRLMLLATLALLGAAVGRIPVLGDHANAITFALVLCVVAYDLVTRSRLHPATVAGGTFLVVGILTEEPIGMTSWWLAFGGRLLALVG